MSTSARFLFPLLLAASLCACSEEDEWTPDGSITDGNLVGYWVWSQHVDGADTVLTITDDDLAVGDWPGCPSGIICTHYGIKKLHFGEGGSLYYIHNVTTSSDYEYKGTHSVADDLVTYTFTEHFSCAHPNINDTDTRSGHFRYRFLGGNLWVSVRSFDAEMPFFDEPPDDPQQWIVFRQVSEEDYNNRYMIRVCVGTDDECHPDCFPEKFGTWGT